MLLSRFLFSAVASTTGVTNPSKCGNDMGLLIDTTDTSSESLLATIYPASIIAKNAFLHSPYEPKV